MSRPTGPDGDARPRPVWARIVPPSRGETVISAAITVSVTFVAGLFASFLVGFPAFWVNIALTDPTADGTKPTGLPDWVTKLLFVVVAAVLVPVASRAGQGTWGDSILELKALTVTGELASRRRNLARAALALAVLAVGVLLGHPGAGMAALVLQWLPALVRPDRRSLVDLAAGVVPHTTATRRQPLSHKGSPA